MWYTAFIIGLVGSLHCIGMCGPIALLVPADNSKKAKFILGKLVYNLGRISTYVFLGSIIGYIGESMGYFISQKYLSAIIGVALIIGIMLPSKIQNKLGFNFVMFRITHWFKHIFSKLMPKRTWMSQYIFGLINGLLPCGMVYVALSGAFLAENNIESMKFMLGFGLGTLPLMLGVSIGADKIRRFFGNKAPKLIPISYTMVGIWLIVRGFSISLPMIIKQNIDFSQIPFCH